MALSSDGVLAKKIDAEHHGGDDGHRIGLEQVGRHARAVADIVADIVGDGRRVARIVLGNAGFDLADEIGADVGALGEDAAAETGEDRDQRGAEAERDQRVDDCAVDRRDSPSGRSGCRNRPATPSSARPATSMPVTAPALNAMSRPPRERLGRRLRRAHIGAHRDVHADEAGCAREDRADQEADRDVASREKNQSRTNMTMPTMAMVVYCRLQIGLRAFGDRAGDLLHARGARVGGHQPIDGDEAVNDGQEPA